MERFAMIEGEYRYQLGRSWSPAPVPGPAPTALFVMLNPSTADAHGDDPTIRRCVALARGWGCCALSVVNLFAYRTSYPGELLSTARRGLDIVGPQNDATIQHVATLHWVVICAWGVNARLFPERVKQVLKLLPKDCTYALKLSKDGIPLHPLARGKNFIPTNTIPKRWP